MKQGFDVRIVSYEHIHSIKPKDAKALIDAVNPKPGETILDGMCGYGAAGKAIIKRCKDANVYFLDESKVQVQRARKNLPNIPRNHFVTKSLLESEFKENFFDAVVIKMGLHEVPKKQQLTVIKEVKRILKPTGRLIIWDIMLDAKTQKLFQDVIRKKDELSGFKLLTKERYFFTEKEFLYTIKRAGLKKIKEYHTIHYRFSSKKRLESELHNDKRRLEKLNEYIRTRFLTNLKESMLYREKNGNIEFNIIKKIFTAVK